MLSCWGKVLCAKIKKNNSLTNAGTMTQRQGGKTKCWVNAESFGTIAWSFVLFSFFGFGFLERKCVSCQQSEEEEDSVSHHESVKTMSWCKIPPKTPIKLKAAAGERLAESCKSALMDELRVITAALASSHSPPPTRCMVSSGCSGSCCSVFP